MLCKFIAAALKLHLNTLNISQFNTMNQFYDIIIKLLQRRPQWLCLCGLFLFFAYIPTAVANSSNFASNIFNVACVVTRIDATVANSSNFASNIVNVACVVTMIPAAVANSSNFASNIVYVACVVIIFLGPFFSINDEVLGIWFPRDLGVQGEEEADCQGKKCYLQRAHVSSPH